MDIQIWKCHAAAYDVSSTDGINEKGLACHALWLADLDLINKAFLEYGIYF
jgi:penicillin V acylase-like amidase (Ntn superfamily)